MEPELVFSGGLMTALTVLFAVCILVPVMFYVWTMYRHRMNHVAILAGVAAFFLFSFLLAENLLNLLAPEGSYAAMGMWPYALVRALCVAVSEVLGITAGLWFLHRQGHATLRVPNGLGLGFRLFEMFYLGAVSALIRLVYVMSVGRDGLAAVLDQVDETQRTALELQLRNLAESNVGTYWMSAVDYVCRFTVPVVLARLIWYAFEGGRESADRRFIAIAFGLDFGCELMLALHQAGGSYHLCAAIYYVLVAGMVCLLYAVSRRRDDPEQIHADRLKDRNIPKRRRY